jgi:hypothetical protein
MTRTTAATITAASAPFIAAPIGQIIALGWTQWLAQITAELANLF